MGAQTDLELLIDELLDLDGPASLSLEAPANLDAFASVTVPERERIGRVPSASELLPPSSEPTVMVDASLCLERRVPSVAPPIARGTIPPLLNGTIRVDAVYCLVDPTADTDPVERTEVDDLTDDMIEELDAGALQDLDDVDDVDDLDDAYDAFDVEV